MNKLRITTYQDELRTYNIYPLSFVRYAAKTL